MSTNLKKVFEYPNGFPAHPKNRFKNNSGKYPLTSDIHYNVVRLIDLIDDPKVHLLFFYLTLKLKPSNDILTCMTVDINFKLFTVISKNRYIFNQYRSILESLNVLKKVNDDNKCTLYYLNPVFYNLFTNQQKKDYYDEFDRPFIPYPNFQL